MTIAVVVIATAGRRVHLGRALGAIDGQTRPPDDVVVVDMRPSDPLADVVRPPARAVPLATGDADGPLPLAAARNAGAAATAAEHVVFLDVDCVPDQRLVERYETVLRAHPDALACGPVRYLHRGWAADAPSSDRFDGISDAPASRPVPPGDAIRVGDDHEMFWSLSFGVSRVTWNAIGGFDEGYRGYGAEDTDFAFQARACGARMAWFGGGVAYHQWHPPTRFDPARTPEIVANARRFRARWGTWPMEGWLRDLHDRGLVDFDGGAGRLQVGAGGR